MIRCTRCGEQTPRLTLGQRHCPTCAREVAALLRSDLQRRAPRFPFAKDLTGHREPVL